MTASDKGPVKVERIHVRFSDDGKHIRKWASAPFEGSTSYAQQALVAELVEAVEAWAADPTPETEQAMIDALAKACD